MLEREIESILHKKSFIALKRDEKTIYYCNGERKLLHKQ